MNGRIVITGLGVVSSIGIGKAQFWKALIQGRSGISKITSFDTSEFPTHFGGEIKDFQPETFIHPRKIPRMGRTSLLAIAAAKMAVEDSRLALQQLNRERIGVCFGSTMGESQIIQLLDEAWVKQGEAGLKPGLIPQCPCNAVASNLAMEIGLKGPNYVITNACAAGNFSIGYAFDLLRADEADMMLAGGADAFSRIAFTGFNRMLAVAPQKCQPFDKNRKGIMVGEGAGMLILEPLENALSRKAEIYAEILGYGVSCDAHHMTAPESNGISVCLTNALRESRILPQDIDYINAHGTGTPANDREECLAIKKVFGEFYRKIPVSSIKSMLGHTMGAASAIETIACCLSVKEGIIPPTINYETPDPECDIDCVPNAARRQRTDIALNNSSAFGGNNACLVLKKFAA